MNEQTRIDHALTLERLDQRRLSPPRWRPLLAGDQGPAATALAVLRAADQDAAGADFEWEDLPAALGPRWAARLCAPWLQPAELDDLARLDEHLRAKQDFPELDCQVCDQRAAQDEPMADCRGCPHVPAPDGCHPALELFRLQQALPEPLRPALAKAALDALGQASPWPLLCQLALMARFGRGGERPAENCTRPAGPCYD